MPPSTQISGLNGQSLGQILKTELCRDKPTALGLVFAFVSVSGLRELIKITRPHGQMGCRLLAGISREVTHPSALIEAVKAGWEVRLGAAPGGHIFHPKMIISGLSFEKDGSVKDPLFTYIGSSNLTRGGLRDHIECGLLSQGDFVPPEMSSCYARLWQVGRPATQSRLDSYAELFARRNRRRSPDDLKALEVSDSKADEVVTYDQLSEKSQASTEEAMPITAAAAAWTGLESFTGEYKFQVEFPKDVSLVLKRIFRRAGSEKVSILCSDNVVREMSYHFYEHNGMSRLNIPNDVPGVSKARAIRKGIAIIEEFDPKIAIARLTILPPGRRTNEIVRRSAMLGTWGCTTTRSYGWY
jgi:hypothetical protein